MEKILIEIFGWVGMILILAAYLLNSSGKLSSQGYVYQLMNFFGTIGTSINAFYKHAWPILALQVIWNLISIYSIWKIYQNKTGLLFKSG